MAQFNPFSKWVDRELGRQATGGYLDLPKEWIETGINFFPVVNETTICPAPAAGDPRLVSFFRNEKAAIEDVRSLLRPGRFLMRFHPGMAPARRDQLVAAYQMMYGKGHVDTVNIAKTDSEIVSIYSNSSLAACMTGVKVGGVAPALVYGGGSDFEVAYLGSIAKPKARTIICRKLGAFVRIYGDEVLMKRALKEIGINKSIHYRAQVPEDLGQSIIGLRLRAHPLKWIPHVLIFPYLDFSIPGAIWEGGPFLEISTSEIVQPIQIRAGPFGGTKKGIVLLANPTRCILCESSTTHIAGLSDRCFLASVTGSGDITVWTVNENSRLPFCIACTKNRVECAGCGLLVYVSTGDREKMGSCPGCGRKEAKWR